MAKDDPVINFHIAGTGLMIEPWDRVAFLGRHLSVDRKTGTKWDYVKKRQTFTKVRHMLFRREVREDGSTFAITYAGFLKTLLAGVEKMGLRSRVIDTRKPLPAPQLDQIQEPLRPRQGEILMAIAENHQCMIVVPTGYGKTFLMVRLPRVYPEAKLLLVTAGKEAGRQLLSRCREANPGETIALVGDGHAFPRSKKPFRICVCLKDSLHHIPTDWADIITFDEAHTAASQDVMPKLTAMTAERVYGFTASPTGRSDGTDKITTACFGEPGIVISYADAVVNKAVTPIKVLMVRSQGPHLAYKTFHALEKYGIWRNVIRNRDIATGARLLEDMVKDDCQLLIMVKSVEHALCLQTMLPDYTAVFNPIDAAREKELRDHPYITHNFDPHPNTEELTAAFARGELKKAISTGVWRQAVDFPRLPLLIRADGQCGPIASTQIPGRMSRLFEGKDEAILMDFMDFYGPDLVGRSTARRNWYATMGWEILDFSLQA